MRTFLLTIAVWLGLAGAVPAAAWVPRKVCAGGDEQTWESNTFPATISSLSWADAPTQGVVADAITSWDDQYLGDSAIGLTTSVAPALMIRGDDENVVAVVNAAGFVGAADVRGRSCADFNELIECDMWLSNTYTWLQPSTYYDQRDQLWFNNQYFLDETVRHEIGHCLGLGHTAMLADSEHHLATMNPYYGGRTVVGEREYIGVRPHDVTEDDRTGIRAMYPDNGLTTDIAAQSYFYDDTAYVPWVCQIWARADPPTNLTDLRYPVICDRNLVNAPPAPLEAFPGAMVTARFTALNLGTWDHQQVAARIVLTPENDPTPSFYTVVDTFEIQTLSSDLPLELERTFTVPTALEGNYYVVLQLDYGDAIAEDNEDNNEVFWNRQIAVVDSVGCSSCNTAGGAGPWWLVGLIALAARRRMRP